MVYPVGLCIELILAGVICLYLKRIRLAYAALLLALSVLLVFSSKFTADALVGSLERKYPPIDETVVKADAIVVLGGSCRPVIPPRTQVEYNEGAERIFEGIRLFKAGAAPVVIPTGGGIDFMLKGQKEGNDMRTVMLEYGVPDSAVLAEVEARNTYENAKYVKELMLEKKIPLNVLLVTSAAHMTRSVPIFKKAGFQVIPVPVDYLVDEGKGSIWFELLPSVDSLMRSTQAIKEYIGILIYKMLGWL